MTLDPGTFLGPYEIVALLGSGGMGEVYRARDPRLQRDVAIKILKSAGVAESMAQFVIEARAVAAITHPNIMAVHDYGEQHGTSYIVYELLEGESLRSRLTRGALPWRLAVEIAGDIATGLAAAHAKGIVHGDVKPENVFITREGRVTLVDFGLARLARAGDDPSELTQPLQPMGNVVGTIAYMAPETLSGDPAGPASDIFALGCVLYEMITGHQAFAATSMLSTVTRILNSDPPPIGDSAAEVPADIEAILERCLSKQPTSRFGSARDLALTLRSLLSSTSRMRVFRTARRSLRWWIPALAALVIVCAAAGLWAYLRDEKETAISIAVLPFENATANPDAEYAADGLTESLINSLSQVPALSVRARASVFKLKGQPVEKAAHDLNADVVVTGRIRSRGNSVVVSAELVRPAEKRQLWGKVYDRRADQLLGIQEEIAAEVIEALHVQVSAPVRERISARMPSNSDAYELYLRGRFHLNKRTEASFIDALAFFARAIDRDPTFALGYSGMADCYVLLNGYGLRKPEEVVPKAKAAATRALELDPDLAEAHATLAAIANHDYDWRGAESEYRKAIALNPSYVTARQWYAGLLTGMGRFDEAMAQLEVARQLDPLSLALPVQIGLRYYFDRRFDDAIASFRGCFELSPDFATAHEYIGLAYECKKMYTEAAASDAKARQARGESEADLAVLQRAFERGGYPARQRVVIERMLRERKTRYVSGVELAAFYASVGERERALAELQDAVDHHASSTIWIKLEPRLDPLRGEPQFQAMLRKVGL